MILGLCFRCLDPSHRAFSCDKICQDCGGRHHAVLCIKNTTNNSTYDNAPGPTASNNVTTTSQTEIPSAATSIVSTNLSIPTENKTRTALPIVEVTIIGPHQGTPGVKAKLLFDSGSDRTYVTQSVVQRLRPLFVGTECIEYAAFGGGKSCQNYVKNMYQLNILGTVKGAGSLTAIEVPLICKPLCQSPIPLSKLACFSIHLELIDSLALNDCMLAIRRFCSRRGMVNTFYSDNAKTFVSASKLMETHFGPVAPKWKFIVPRSPWWGGWWERLIRSVKSALKKSLGVNCFSRTELETCLIEIEACINSRPLTFVGDTLDNMFPLTPSHFLINRCAGFQPSVDDSKMEAMTPVSFRERYSLIQQRLELFWSRWTNDYLRNLPSIVKGSKSQGNLQVGSVVLVHEDNISRLKWPLGVIIKLYPGRDGIVRSVLVKTAKGEISRSIQRLHNLEIIDSPDKCDAQVSNHSEVCNESSPVMNRSISDNVHVPLTEPVVSTRSGRVVVKPNRYDAS